MTTSASDITVRIGDGSVSALLLRPANARALYLFAHGAGAGITHKAMESNAQGLAERGVATLRYQFPYMGRVRNGPIRPGSRMRLFVQRPRKPSGSLRTFLCLRAAARSAGG